MTREGRMTRGEWWCREDDKRESETGAACSAKLYCGQSAHFAVFQREVLASPGYCVSGEAPDPDAQGYYVAGGQQPQITDHLAVPQHAHADGEG
jgi:hypothetical protein